MKRTAACYWLVWVLFTWPMANLFAQFPANYDNTGQDLGRLH